MNHKQLQRAKKLEEELIELERFMFTASRVRKGTLIKRFTDFIFKSNGYGYFEPKEYLLDNEMKNRVLKILEDRIIELKNEMENL
jgi:hypothetical protein